MLQCSSFFAEFFSEYSKSDSILLKKDGILHKRIGLLKQHADRAAAHLSLENYSIDINDLAHFTASVTVVGEIVRSFDKPWTGETYFNEIDQGAYEAAKRVFPQISDFRLFGHMQVHQQARFYWKQQNLFSIQTYFDQLPLALG